MSAKIVQINFGFSMSRAEYEGATRPAAGTIADTPGLRWKVWLMDEAERTAGGIYLFDDEASAQAFLAGPIVASLASNPALTHLSVKAFDVLEEHSAITRGPIAQAEPAARARTFSQMVADAMAAVPVLTPSEARQRMEGNPDSLVLHVCAAEEKVATGTVPGALAISYGALTYKADNELPEEWREPQLADRDRPIITTCELGPLGALGAKLLHDMGFRDVAILAGGVQAWKDAGLPLEPLPV